MHTVYIFTIIIKSKIHPPDSRFSLISSLAVQPSSLWAFFSYSSLVFSFPSPSLLRRAQDSLSCITCPYHFNRLPGLSLRFPPLSATCNFFPSDFCIQSSLIRQRRSQVFECLHSLSSFPVNGSLGLVVRCTPNIRFSFY